MSTDVPGDLTHRQQTAAIEGLLWAWTEAGLFDPQEKLFEIEMAREAGKIIITTNGCFDILHRGHLKNLAEARRMGDLLVVGLNSDVSVRLLKGPGRPVITQAERSAMLAALRFVDYVFVFDDLLPNNFLEKIKPHYHVKAGDYDSEIPEAPVVRRHGGQIIILPLEVGYSTSEFIQRVQKLGEPTEMCDDQVHAARQFQANEAVLLGILEGSNVLRHVAYHLVPEIIEFARLASTSIRKGGKVLACGNGGSAADAQHFVAELVGRFRHDRPAWPALSLSSDPSIMASLANDYGYDQVFARQVSAWGNPGDLLVALSTSGSSANVVAAVREGKQRDMRVVALTGSRASPLSEWADFHLRVPSVDTPIVQQAHMAILHAVCNLVEQDLAPPETST